MLRILKSAEQELDEQEDEQDEYEYPLEDEQETTPPNNEGTLSSNCPPNVLCPSSDVIDTQNDLSSPLHEIQFPPIITDNRSLLNAVWKSKSPTVTANILGHPVIAIIDNIDTNKSYQRHYHWKYLTSRNHFAKKCLLKVFNTWSHSVLFEQNSLFWDLFDTELSPIPKKVKRIF